MGSLETILIAVLVIVRTVNVFTAIIPDCDEVFNYYEPLNFFVRGFGKQTWEYSPEFAIRSWSYLLPYSIPITPLARIVDSYKLSNSIVFYAIRFIIVIFTVYSELHLFNTLKRYWTGSIANWYLFLSAVSTGYSQASVALLPSSLAMNCVCLATSNFIRYISNRSTRNALLVTYWFVIGGLFGWPFSLALALPSVLYILTTSYNDDVKFRRYILWSTTTFFFFLVTIMEIDYHYYEKSVVVPMNIVLYNVFNADESTGPNIFGIEPVSYYVNNLLLNFNLIGVLGYSGIILIPVLAWFRNLKFSSTQLIMVVSCPIVLWSSVFFSQPHKEERFLYPIYSLINLSASVTIPLLINLITSVIPFKRISAVVKIFTIALAVLSIGSISILRTISLSTNYSAPLKVYEAIPTNAQGNLCLGREWHRYPSSFFLPNSLRLKFIRSGFDGLLPGDFDETVPLIRAISKIPEHMNNLNKFEIDKIVDFEQCDYVIDIDQPVDDEINEVRLIDQNGKVLSGWKLIHSEPFLNNEESTGLGRLLYLPSQYLYDLTKTTLIHNNYSLYVKVKDDDNNEI